MSTTSNILILRGGVKHIIKRNITFERVKTVKFAKTAVAYARRGNAHSSFMTVEGYARQARACGKLASAR